MNAHHFLEIKVGRFCITLIGQARMWYQYLEPINVDWQGLQDLFRQQYPKIVHKETTIPHVDIISF